MAGETLGFQVHHVFPTDFFKNNSKLVDDLNRVMGDSLITKDDYSNRINLFNNQEMADVMKSFYASQNGMMKVADSFGSVMHKGSENNHLDYNKFIKESIEKILKMNSDDSTKKYLILDLHKKVSHALKVGDMDLKGDIDYYDEKLSNKLVDVDDLAVLDKNGFYKFNSNSEAVKVLQTYEKSYNRTSMVSNETVVKEDFNKAIAKIDLSSKVYDVPYSQITINSIKEALAKNDTNIMRRALG